MTNVTNYSKLGSKRLPHYDYSLPGAYFVTVCTAIRLCIFGEITEGEMRLNKNGLIAAEQWVGLPSHYPRVSIDEFVIMPNHIHGIICLSNASQASVGAGFQPAHTSHPTNQKHGIPEIIRGFKTYSSLTINRFRGTTGEPVWQRNYYEHVVRNEKDLDAIRKYIVENPLKWELDPENPAVRGMVNAERSGLKTRAYGHR
ncbi:MAG: transposase [Chloroflexi bacterium]|nr:transposase [Chloroflexota bacterium]